MKAIYVDEEVHKKLFLMKLEKRKRSINQVLREVLNI